MSSAIFSSASRSGEGTAELLAQDFIKAVPVGADEEYTWLCEAARQIGGRLLLVDENSKVQTDTYGSFVGHMITLPEVMSVMNGQKVAGGAHHVRESTESIVPGLENVEYVGFFAATLRKSNSRGTLLLVVNLQKEAEQFMAFRRWFAIGLLSVWALIVIISALLCQQVTQPVYELAAGIARMGKGEYGERVRVRGKGELARLAADFNEMSERVKNLDETRSEFVSNASHELKTPLATIKILVESMLYQKKMDANIQQEFLTDIDQEIDRLTAVVGDLLTLVHMDSKKGRLMRESIRFGDTVRESVARLRPQAERRGQELHITIYDECEMEGDAGKLGQVCYNIIGNAIKYTPEGGKIDILLTRSGRDALFEVKDTGIGIPEEDLPHIFERFYRVEKSRTRGTDAGGTGLGLAIVLQIVRLHAGSIDVQSELGVGTTFTVQLPVKQEKIDGIR